MGYKPTLGGLKKAQKFLNTKGYPMPVFQMNIYDDARLAGLRFVPGKGQTISINYAIKKYGAMCEVEDVRLANKTGDKFILFNKITRCGLFTAKSAMDNGWDVIIEYSNGDQFEFRDFMNSNDGCIFLNLARWGKMTFSFLDRIKFRFFPKKYSAEVFD